MNVSPEAQAKLVLEMEWPPNAVQCPNGADLSRHSVIGKEAPAHYFRACELCHDDGYMIPEEQANA